MTKGYGWTVPVLALAAVGLLAAGCSNTETAQASTGEAAPAKKDAGAKPGDPPKEEAVPVEVTALETGPIESVLRYSSNLEAESHVTVFSQAKRLVVELLVEEGQRVREGQTLLRLQDDEQRSALDKVASQLARAEREYERQNRLYTQGMISEQEFNDARYELDQLRISIEDARRELGYTEVNAPIGGTITARMVNLGDQVQIGQQLFEIVDFDSLVARVFVPEKHLPAMSRGLTARLSTQAAVGRSYACAVERIAPVVDPKSGTVKVTVDVGGQEGLRPGMYVDVELVVATEDDAVLVPKRALVYDNDQMYVFRVGEDRRAERLFIEPRLSDKHHVEPVAGLAAGDLLVVAGQAGLKDGALVKLPGDAEPQAADAVAAGGTPEATEQAAL